MSDVSQSVPQSILMRINKLLSLADSSRGATEAEALVAASKAQELLQEYGLSVAEVEAAGGKVDDGGREKRVTDRSALHHWRKNLMVAIAETNFCMHRVKLDTSWDETTDKRRKTRTHQLVGRKVNVEATIIVYDYLIATMKRLVREAGYKPGNETEKKYHAWLDGCSERLCERLEAKAEEARKASKRPVGNGSGKELILSDVYGSEKDLNNDALNGYPAGTTAARRREAEEKQKRFDERYAELQASGMERIEAWYTAHGYGAESAKQLAADYHKKDGKPSRRSGRRGGSSRGWRGNGFTQADARRAERRNSAAFSEGASVGDRIGLDPQADHVEKKLIGSNK